MNKFNKILFTVGNIGFIATCCYMIHTCNKLLNKSTYAEISRETFETKVNNPLIIHKIDSFEKESNKILNDTSYKFYGCDTVPAVCFDHIHERINSKMPLTQVGTETTVGCVSNGKIAFPMAITTPKYEDNYIEPRVVINSKKRYFDVLLRNPCVPVEYYGIKNPVLK